MATAGFSCVHGGCQEYEEAENLLRLHAFEALGLPSFVNGLVTMRSGLPSFVNRQVTMRRGLPSFVTRLVTMGKGCLCR